LEIRERVYGPDHSYVGTTCEEMGRAYLALGDPEAAEASLRRAIAIGIADGRHRDHRVTKPTIALARVLKLQGRQEEAANLLEEERAATTEEGQQQIDEALRELSSSA
jgi:Flp pilus assembly protein TadD